MLKRIQDCYQTFADYFFPSVKTDLSQQKTLLFLLETFRLMTQTWQTQSCPSRVKSAEGTGLLTNTGTMSNGAYIYLDLSLNPPFEKLINLKLICYTIINIKNHVHSSSETGVKTALKVNEENSQEF